MRREGVGEQRQETGEAKSDDETTRSWVWGAAGVRFKVDVEWATEIGRGALLARQGARRS